MTVLFVPNANGRGFQPTARGRLVLRIWDLASWIVAAVFFGTLLTQGAAPWWLFILALPFFIAPLFAMMFFTGLGPVSALMHYVRRADSREVRK